MSAQVTPASVQVVAAQEVVAQEVAAQAVRAAAAGQVVLAVTAVRVVTAIIDGYTPASLSFRSAAAGETIG